METVKTIAMSLAIILMTACSNSSIVVEKGGNVTAKIEGSGFHDFRDIVKNFKSAIHHACSNRNGISIPNTDIWKLYSDVNSNNSLSSEQKARITFLLNEYMQNRESTKQLAEDLRGLLPSHHFSWSGNCSDFNPSRESQGGADAGGGGG